MSRISESINLDEYKLIDLRMEQPDGLSHEHMSTGMAPTSDMGSTVYVYVGGWHHVKQFNGTASGS